MAKFEEIQKLWQSGTKYDVPRLEDLVRDLRGHSRRQVGFYAVKTGVVVALAAVIVAEVRHSAVALAGALLVIAGAGTAIIVEWIGHLNLARLEFTAAAAGFTQAAIGRLRRLERPRAVEYAALILGPITGLNLIVAGLFADLDWQWKAMGHLLLSLAAFAGIWGGFRFRARRFDHETRPLLQRLETFAAAMQESDGSGLAGTQKTSPESKK